MVVSNFLAIPLLRLEPLLLKSARLFVLSLLLLCLFEMQ